MRNVVVTSLVVVGLLAGYAGAYVKIAPGWSDDFAGYDAYPGGGEGGGSDWTIPDNPGDTEPYWFTTKGSVQITFEKTFYAPFNVAGVHAYHLYHQNQENAAGVELASYVTSGQAILTWQSALGEYVAGVFAPTIRVGPLHYSDPDLLQVSADGLAIATVNADEGSQGLQLYLQKGFEDFVASSVISTGLDVLLDNTLTMDMTADTVQYVVRKASDSSLIWDSGVQTNGWTMDEVAGWSLGGHAGGEPDISSTFEGGWTNPAYDIPEPATMAVLLLGGVAGLLRRRG